MPNEGVGFITVGEIRYAVHLEAQIANAVLQTNPYVYLKDVVEKDIQKSAVGIAARRTAFAAMGNTTAVMKKRVVTKTSVVLKKLLVMMMVSPKHVVTRTFRRVVMAMDVLTRASPSSTPLDVSCLISHFLLVAPRVTTRVMVAHLAG